MRIIVNEKQYKRLLKNQHNTKKYISEWANYVEDVLYPYLNEVTEEDTFTLKNLRNKIGKTNFFKELPIENINVNLLKGNKDKVYLGEVYNEGRVVKDLELDVYISDKNKRADNFLHEFIKLNNKVLLNEQHRIVISDNVWDKLNDENIYSEEEKNVLLNRLGSIHLDIFNFTGKPIVVKDVNEKENTVIIENPNFTQEQISLLLNREGVTEYWDMRLNDQDVEIKLRRYSWDDSVIGGYYSDTILVEPEYHDHDHNHDDDDETDDEEIDIEKVIIDIGAEDLKVPSEGSVKNSFGWRRKITSLCNQGNKRYCDWHFHDGEDYPRDIGTPIYVFKPGKVTQKGSHTLTIKHDDGSLTKYAHCDKYFVKNGDTIEPGTLIGTVGNEGGSTGPHLHFEYAPDANGPKKDYTVTKKSFKTGKQKKFPHKSRNIDPKNVIDDYVRFGKVNKNKEDE